MINDNVICEFPWNLRCAMEIVQVVLFWSSHLVGACVKGDSSRANKKPFFSLQIMCLLLSSKSSSRPLNVRQLEDSQIHRQAEHTIKIAQILLYTENDAGAFDITSL